MTGASKRLLGGAAAAITVVVVVALARYVSGTLAVLYVVNYPLNYGTTIVAWATVRRSDAMFWLAFWTGLALVAIDVILPLALLGSLPLGTVLALTAANAAANWLVIPMRAALLVYRDWPVVMQITAYRGRMVPA